MDVKSAACLSAVHSVDSQVDAVLDAARSQMHTCDIYGLGEQCVLALDKLADTLRPNFLLQPCHRLVEVRREVLQLIKVKLVRHHPEMARSRLLSTLRAGGKRSERPGVSSDSLLERGCSNCRSRLRFLRPGKLANRPFYCDEKLDFQSMRPAVRIPSAPATLGNSIFNLINPIPTMGNI